MKIDTNSLQYVTITIGWDVKRIDMFGVGVYKNVSFTLRNKGTKAVTGAVPFQKVHVC